MDALRRAHDVHGGPLIVYAENLVYSTLDYGYTEQDLPALVGFDVLPYAAVDYIWAEHWQEIMDLEVTFTPADVYPLVAKRCVTEIRKMETNAELNDADPTTTWQHLS